MSGYRATAAVLYGECLHSGYGFGPPHMEFRSAQLALSSKKQFLYSLL